MRGQAIAITLVLASGIATYVTMRSAFRSLEVAQTDYYSRFRFADVFTHVKRAPDALSAAISKIPGVATVQTRVVMDVTLDVPGLDEPATGRLVSIPERRKSMLNDIFLREGRYIESSQPDEVLVSEAFAAANHLSVGGSLAAVMNGNWERLRIVGIALSPEYIYEIRPSEVFPDSRRFGVLWMSRDVLEATFNMKAAFNDAAISLTHGAYEREVISRLDQMLDRYGCLGAYGRADQVSFRFLTDELGELRAYGLILPGLFLGIVAFLLHVLLARLVTTQRGQVAVLKAFGYSNFEVGLHYLELAMATVIVGTFAGVGFGLWLASGMMSIYARYFHFPELRLHADPDVILFAVAVSAGAACLGAASAVRRTVSLAPADAMRPVPPAAFGPGLLERLRLHRVLSPESRMIIRNLDRRRWRAILSTVAIALSIAIVVSGRYSIDAVNRLVRVQFQTIQREDVTVAFHEPRPGKVRHELANFAGVLRVEPYRELPSRLRLGHRSHRIALLGLVAAGDMRRLVDERLRPLELPSDGLVLNSKLAEILAANVGSIVTVEILEGARPVREIPVAAVVDEPVGLGAYMHIDALHRLAREGDTISGAYLGVDRLIAPKLYSALKLTPSISGVAVREAMLASFWKTFGESIWISTAFLVGFATVIAFGIVYSGARMALSERGNELACLRVLGYTRGEIGRILLGEQALVMLAAVPVGFGVGFALCLLLSRFFSRDLFRLPLVVNAGTYAFSAIVVLAASLLSGLVVAERVRRMDLTAVLKARE